MRSREDLLGALDRILWLEKEMMAGYASYKKLTIDEDLAKTLESIEKDEMRHVGMVQRMMGILQMPPGTE